MFKFEMTGLRKLEKKLKRMESKARALDGAHDVPLNELLTDPFIGKHTRCRSGDEWFEQSPFTIESQEDFAAIPDDAWDPYVCETTTFSNWQEMLESAGAEYFKKGLGLRGLHTPGRRPSYAQGL